MKSVLSLKIRGFMMQVKTTHSHVVTSDTEILSDFSTQDCIKTFTLGT